MFSVKFWKPHASCHFQMAVICSYILFVTTVVAFELLRYQFITVRYSKIKLKCVCVYLCILCALTRSHTHISIRV